MLFLWKRDANENDSKVIGLRAWLKNAIRGFDEGYIAEDRSNLDTMGSDMGQQIAALIALYELDNNAAFDEVVQQREFKQFMLSQDGDIKPFHDDFLRVNRERRLFISQSGRMGNGSSFIESGDEIVIFSGAGQPMIVRNNDDSTDHLLSPAYIHGVMKGESWDSDWSFENGLDKFVLA
jgi:hypothetical protein